MFPKSPKLSQSPLCRIGSLAESAKETKTRTAIFSIFQPLWKQIGSQRRSARLPAGKASSTALGTSRCTFIGRKPSNRRIPSWRGGSTNRFKNSDSPSRRLILGSAPPLLFPSITSFHQWIKSPRASANTHEGWARRVVSSGMLIPFSAARSGFPAKTNGNFAPLAKTTAASGG